MRTTELRDNGASHCPSCGKLHLNLAPAVHACTRCGQQFKLLPYFAPPPEVRPVAYRYEDQYGNERWSDIGDRVASCHGGR